MISSLLIANRGEIACRIIHTARRMGIRTVAIYSDADRSALHVRRADEAVHIGASPARESYLVGDKIIAAAKATGAEAIHPGYGFLSENAEFAEAVEAAGLIWVGPTAGSIRAMGLKDAAKALMIEAGVPVTPGYLGEDQAPERLQAEADGIGYPVLIKAVAGGGGKGMRKVGSSAEFQEMLASCKREAASSFGDDRVLIEKYVERPRHIEVQVFGDTHGNVVHLFERDCSLQRRHQKVIEEAPAPGMDEATRAAVCDAAVKAAKAVDYVGAGTIEFIADASEGLRPDRIWFMEMNTRLQVEHPVTEEITGQDLVEWQLRVASGERLPLRQEELAINGWAMEARLYAEDPINGFLPSTGKLEWFRLSTPDPDHLRVRYDMGVDCGDVVTPNYDPMLGKIVAHGCDRDDAIEHLTRACSLTGIWPVKTNMGFVERCLGHPLFRTGEIDTGFIPSHLEELLEIDLPGQAMADWVALDLLPPAEQSPWGSHSGFRLNGQPDTRVILYDDQGHRYEVDFTRRPQQAFGGMDNIVKHAGEYRAFSLQLPHGAGAASASDGAVTSPMPGRVIALDVHEGARVTKGQKLVTLEAMKMEHSMVAPFDGVVAELAVEAGSQVSEGAMLVRVEKGE